MLTGMSGGDAPGRPAARGDAPAAPVVRPRGRRESSLRRVAAWCAAVAAALHSLAVGWLWWSDAPGLRTTALVWLDLPSSLLYLHLVGRSILPWSLLLGGLQWATTGALLAWLVAWSSRRG